MIFGRFRPTKYARLAMLMLLLPAAAALTISLSQNYSRDYEIYIDLITWQEPTDFAFDAFVRFGYAIDLEPSRIYSLYVSSLVVLMAYFFWSRRISGYWILIYLLNFYLLHPVTQIRASTASLLVAVFLSSRNPTIRALTLVTPLAHISAGIFATAGLAAKNRLLIAFSFVAPVAALFLYQPAIEKLARYVASDNETRSIPFGLIEYLLFTTLLVLSRLDRSEKARISSIVTVTLAIYLTFIDYAAISNRFLEISFAVVILHASYLDRKLKLWTNDKIIMRHSYGLILLMSLGHLYVQCVRNSVLSF